MGRGGRSIDRYGVAVASLIGIGERFAHMRRISREDALVEVADRIAGLAEDRRRDAFSEAASYFLVIHPAYTYGPDAIALLVEAGADPDVVKEFAAARDDGRSGLSGLGDQAARL